MSVWINNELVFTSHTCNPVSLFPISFQRLLVRQRDHLIRALKTPRWRHRALCLPPHHTASCLDCLALLQIEALSPWGRSLVKKYGRKMLLCLIGDKQSLLPTSKMDSCVPFTQESTISQPFRIRWSWWWEFPTWEFSAKSFSLIDLTICLERAGWKHITEEEDPRANCTKFRTWRGLTIIKEIANWVLMSHKI